LCTYNNELEGKFSDFPSGIYVIFLYRIRCLKLSIQQCIKEKKSLKICYDNKNTIHYGTKRVVSALDQSWNKYKKGIRIYGNRKYSNIFRRVFVIYSNIEYFQKTIFEYSIFVSIRILKYPNTFYKEYLGKIQFIWENPILWGKIRFFPEKMLGKNGIFDTIDLFCKVWKTLACIKRSIFMEGDFIFF
jgi:hypothetical protein